MDVTVNGERKKLDDGATIATLLALLGLPREQVAIERNGALVRRRDHDDTTLQTGDILEIVTLVGGG